MLLRPLGSDFDWSHNHDNLPGLTWVSEGDRRSLLQITTFLELGLFNPRPGLQLDRVDESLVSQISNLDFRYWPARKLLSLVVLCRLVSLLLIIHLFSVITCDIGPFNFSCTHRTIQSHGSQTAKVFQPRDKERRRQTSCIPSQTCKPINSPCSCTLKCY
jgi:hypothetical protein